MTAPLDADVKEADVGPELRELISRSGAETQPRRAGLEHNLKLSTKQAT